MDAATPIPATLASGAPTSGTPTSGTPTAPPDAGPLLVRHRDGDADAFAALVAEYRAPVYGYLCRCGIPATERDDLFQDVFLKIHRAAASYDAGRPAHPWIFTIVANTVRNHLRRQRVRQMIRSATGDPDDPPSDPPDPRPDGERRAAARERVRLVERELRRLPDAQRQAVLLAGVEKLSMRDAAAALGIPVGTVKTHLRRARLRLAQALAAARAPSVPPIAGAAAEEMS